MLAPISRSPSYSLLSSAPDMCAIAEGEDCTKAALRKEKEKGVPYPSSTIHEDIISLRMPSQVP
jgi:hypothetical protein